MPKTSQFETAKDSIKPQGGDKGTNKGTNKKRSLLATILTILLVFLIIGGVLAGAVYFVIHNNINGIADNNRAKLQGIPLVKLALPPAEDPLDPKNLTPEDLLSKYGELRKQVADLTTQLEESKKTSDDLQNVKAQYDTLTAGNDKIKSDLQAQQTALDQKKNELDQYKKDIDALVANGDTEGFKAYFEKVDPEVAKQVYAEIVKKQVADENVKKFAQLYESMDASAAGQIFEQMGNSKIDIISEALMAMKKETSAEILAAMTPAFAAKVTEKLNASYKAGK